MWLALVPRLCPRQEHLTDWVLVTNMYSVHLGNSIESAIHSTWKILLSQQEVQKAVSQEIKGWSIQQANMRMEEIQQKAMKVFK